MKETEEVNKLAIRGVTISNPMHFAKMKLLICDVKPTTYSEIKKGLLIQKLKNRKLWKNRLLYVLGMILTIGVVVGYILGMVYLCNGRLSSSNGQMLGLNGAMLLFIGHITLVCNLEFDTSYISVKHKGKTYR